MSSPASTSMIHELRVVISASGPEARRLVIITFVLMIVSAVLDMIGVGAIIPFVAVVSRSDLFIKYPQLALYLPQALIEDRSLLVLSGAALFGAIYLLRAGVMMLNAWYQAQLQGTLSLELSDKLYRRYLRRDYAYHVERGPAFFSARLGDAMSKARDTISNTQQLFVEGLTASLILMLVVAVNPTAALASVVGMGLPAFFIYRYLRHRMAKLSERQYRNGELSGKYMHTGINAIKDIIMHQREAYFQQSHREQKVITRDLLATSELYSNAPRVLLELITVLVLLLLCAVMAWQGRLDQLLVVMGLYAAAAFRLMPCINRLLMASTQLRYCRYGLALVAEDLEDRVHFERPELSDQAMSQLPQPFRQLIIEQVSFRYRPDLPLALNELSLTIRAGETIGFVGTSGAGKSTLIDLILGLYPAQSGRVLIDDQPLQLLLPAWRKRLGYVPQAIYLIDDSILHNVAFGLPDEEIDEARAWQALTSARLESFIRDLPEGINTQVGERGVKLSGGQRQRLGIARALYSQPDVLVLDEATSALDNATEAEFMAAIDALHGQKTILMVAHRLSTVEKCDRICLMQAGQIIAMGTYQELWEISADFRRIAGAQEAQA